MLFDVGKVLSILPPIVFNPQPLVGLMLGTPKTKKYLNSLGCDLGIFFSIIWCMVLLWIRNNPKELGLNTPMKWRIDISKVVEKWPSQLKIIPLYKFSQIPLRILLDYFNTKSEIIQTHMVWSSPKTKKQYVITIISQL